MKVIYLTQEKIALVDDGDFEELNRHKWCAHKNGTRWYAERRDKGKIVYMHRVIMNTPEGMQTDHISGDGLDNRKQNLRNCNQTINSLNAHKLRSNKTSRFRGVSWHRENKKWRAALNLNGRKRHLGLFKTEEEASQKYETAKNQYLAEEINA